MPLFDKFLEKAKSLFAFSNSKNSSFFSKDTNSFERIPDELALQILQNIKTPIELIAFSTINRQFKSLCNDSSLWKTLGFNSAKTYLILSGLKNQKITLVGVEARKEETSAKNIFFRSINQNTQFLEQTGVPTSTLKFNENSHVQLIDTASQSRFLKLNQESSYKGASVIFCFSMMVQMLMFYWSRSKIMQIWMRKWSFSCPILPLKSTLILKQK